jgi:hypothetical protein
LQIELAEGKWAKKAKARTEGRQTGIQELRIIFF